MELIMFITVLCFTFFVLQTPCTCLQIKLESSNQQAQEVQLPRPTLPRKLGFVEEAVAFRGKEAHHPPISNTNSDKEGTGRAYQKEKEEATELVHGRGGRGTRQEWMESGADNVSQYFTMDYSHVRRRRPIHNKSLPVVP